MSSPLIQRLTEQFGYPVVDESSVDEFLQASEHSVLFFTEDPKSFRESDDVAVILPELMKVFGERVDPAVVARHAERALQKRYRFRAWPALVLLRRGAYLGAITRVLNWDEYLAEIERILAAEPSEPPPYRTPMPLARTDAATSSDRGGE